MSQVPTDCTATFVLGYFPLRIFPHPHPLLTHSLNPGDSPRLSILIPYSRLMDFVATGY